MNNQLTFGEMRQLTERFHQILGAAQCAKDRRLETLYFDVLKIAESTMCPLALEFSYTIALESDVLVEKIYKMYA